MALITEKRTIEDIEVSVTQLPAIRSFKLMARLGKILSPAISKLGGLSLETDIQELGPALEGMFVNLTDEDAAILAREILSCATATVNGRAYPLSSDETINTVFSGRLKTMMMAMKFALEVNYRDFFGEALAAANLGEGAEKGSNE